LTIKYRVPNLLNGNVGIVGKNGEEQMGFMSKDSRKKSFSEAFVNSFGSYPIGYGIGVLVLPLYLGWIKEDPFMANIFITFTYAVVSFVRVYFFRRLFVKFGIDDNFLKLGVKLYHRLQNIPRVGL